ncbi:3-oxoadipate enol-lactonase [Nocardia aobensis]|uniref:3-oxoadipate enol-lactonase n=1 Tax=Nocardia aobensis TaxID=257277 RepID=A0ABW6PF13_9NOCA
MSELFDPVLAAGPITAATSDAAWLQAILDAEAALARAQADAGIISRAHAETIADACRQDEFDAGEIGSAAIVIGNPVGPLVRALTARVAQVDQSAAGAVHRGATSQDILDTAAMLVARRAVDELFIEATAIADHLASLAAQHACTPQVGRSLLQQALPITFGLTASGWLTALDSAASSLAEMIPRLAVQLGGAAGTLATLGNDGPAVLAAFAQRTGLAEPVLPWHTDRTRIAGLAAALGTLSGVVAKIARDITLLAQTEIAEVAEIADGIGGSSTLPHKRNPIAAISAAAAAAQAPGLIATLLTASAHEQQRAAGSWHAEWRPFTELLRSTGSAVFWLRTSLNRLRVHPARMRENLSASGGLILAERVTAALAPDVGRLAAHDAITECARSASAETRFDTLLLNHPVLKPHLTADRVHALLEPSGYLGSTREFIDRALTTHAHSTAKNLGDMPSSHGDPEPMTATRNVPAASERPGTGTHSSDRSGPSHPSARPTSQVRPVEVRYQIDGPADGIPILLGNSIGSDLSIWDSYVAPLSDSGFRVIRYDLRGHGDSPVPAGPYTIDDLGADAVTLLDRLGAERVHTVGISLGGMLGLWMARHAPERIDRLVVCCSSARPGNRRMWIDRAAQARNEGMHGIADQSITRWFTPEWRNAHPVLADRMRRLTATTPAEGYAACCELLAELDLEPDLSAITAPTLVISGTGDAALSAEHGRSIAAAIPDARFEIVDNAAHLGTVEQSEHFLDLILQHVRTTT